MSTHTSQQPVAIRIGDVSASLILVDLLAQEVGPLVLEDHLFLLQR